MAKADWELLPAHHAVKRMRNLTAESIQPLPERAWRRNFRSPSEHQLPLTWLCSEDPTWREISSIKSVIIPLSPHLSVSLRQENRSLFQVRIPPFKIWAWRSEAVGVSPYLPWAGGIQPGWCPLPLPGARSEGWCSPFAAPHGWQRWCRAWTLERPCLAVVIGQAPCQSQLGLFLKKAEVVLLFCFSITLLEPGKLRNEITSIKMAILGSPD